jgi:hypothetical protein
VCPSAICSFYTKPLQNTPCEPFAPTPHLGFYRHGIAWAMLKKDSKQKLFQMILTAGKQYITVELALFYFYKRATPLA